ncbi:MAG TPA: hypothetical protein VLH85_04585 [Levilinea sp.]|nr:hypothetical protein [Levilinea sp.]
MGLALAACGTDHDCQPKRQALSLALAHLHEHFDQVKKVVSKWLATINARHETVGREK